MDWVDDEHLADDDVDQEVEETVYGKEADGYGEHEALLALEGEASVAY